MRKPFWLLGVATLMATLVSCNRNAKPEPAVYKFEVYKTQEILINPEDRGTRYTSRTHPLTLLDINGKDALAFNYRLKGNDSYYDLATGKKMSESEVAGVKPVEIDTIPIGENSDLIVVVDEESLKVDTVMPPEVQLASTSEKLSEDNVNYRNLKEGQETFIYDKTNNVYYGSISYDSEYYGENVHTHVVTDKDFKYLGEIYNEKGVWCSNGRIAINYNILNDSVIKVNYLKLTRTDRDYKQYIDSCRADLVKRHNDWEEYKLKYNAETNPVVGLVKTKNEIDEDYQYKVLTLYCKDEITEADKMLIDSLLAKKEIVNLAPIYLVLSAENEETAASYVTKNGLDSINKIVFDTEGISTTDAGQGNPRFMLVEDGLITKDTVYRTEDIAKKMIPRVFGVGHGMQYGIYCEMLIVKGVYPDYFFDD